MEPTAVVAIAAAEHCQLAQDPSAAAVAAVVVVDLVALTAPENCWAATCETLSLSARSPVLSPAATPAAAV